MTRPTLRSSFSILLLVMACGPAPVRPRAQVDPPRADAAAGADAAAADATSATPDGGGSPPPDAGAVAPADASMQRPKLPAPDAGADAAVDAGAAPSADAAVDVGGAPPFDADAEAAAGDAGAASTAIRPPVAGELRIVEVLANPSAQDTGREWIEIVSLSREPLDLSGLHVADTTTDAAAPAGIIAPGGRLLLGQLAEGSKNGGAPVAVAYGTRLAFNNDGEEISLCIGACAGGAVIDRVGWKTLAAGYDGHAIVFDHGANLICPATRPFGVGGDFGTPGEPDDGCPVPDGGSEAN